eukprot:scaffold82948_cov60-Phaeocystis_antarctica.AAC.2
MESVHMPAAEPAERRHRIVVLLVVIDLDRHDEREEDEGPRSGLLLPSHLLEFLLFGVAVALLPRHFVAGVVAALAHADVRDDTALERRDQAKREVDPVDQVDPQHLTATRYHLTHESHEHQDGEEHGGAEADALARFGHIEPEGPEREHRDEYARHDDGQKVIRSRSAVDVDDEPKRGPVVVGIHRVGARVREAFDARHFVLLVRVARGAGLGAHFSTWKRVLAEEVVVVHLDKVFALQARDPEPVPLLCLKPHGEARLARKRLNLGQFCAEYARDRAIDELGGRAILSSGGADGAHVRPRVALCVRCSWPAPREVRGQLIIWEVHEPREAAAEIDGARHTVPNATVALDPCPACFNRVRLPSDGVGRHKGRPPQVVVDAHPASRVHPEVCHAAPFFRVPLKTGVVPDRAPPDFQGQLAGADVHLDHLKNAILHAHPDAVLASGGSAFFSCCSNVAFRPRAGCAPCFDGGGGGMWSSSHACSSPVSQACSSPGASAPRGAMPLHALKPSCDVCSRPSPHAPCHDPPALQQLATPSAFKPHLAHSAEA